MDGDMRAANITYSDGLGLLTLEISPANFGDLYGSLMELAPGDTEIIEDPDEEGVVENWGNFSQYLIPGGDGRYELEIVEMSRQEFDGLQDFPGW